MNTDLCSISLAVMNSTIRCFCYVFDVILFASTDALRRLAQRQIARTSAALSDRRRHRYPVQLKICFYF